MRNCFVVLPPTSPPVILEVEADIHDGIVRLRHLVASVAGDSASEFAKEDSVEEALALFFVEDSLTRRDMELVNQGLIVLV